MYILTSKGRMALYDQNSKEYKRLDEWEADPGFKLLLSGIGQGKNIKEILDDNNVHGKEGLKFAHGILQMLIDSGFVKWTSYLRK